MEVASSRDAGLLEPPERPQGSPASSSVWLRGKGEGEGKMEKGGQPWWEEAIMFQEQCGLVVCPGP